MQWGVSGGCPTSFVIAKPSNTEDAYVSDALYCVAPELHSHLSYC